MPFKREAQPTNRQEAAVGFARKKGKKLPEYVGFQRKAK